MKILAQIPVGELIVQLEEDQLDGQVLWWVNTYDMEGDLVLCGVDHSFFVRADAHEYLKKAIALLQG